MRRTAAGGALLGVGFALGATGASLAGHHEQPRAVVSLQLGRTPHASAFHPPRTVHHAVPARRPTVPAVGPADRPAPGIPAPPADTPTPAPGQSPAAVVPAAGPGNSTGIDISLNPLALLTTAIGPICNLDHGSDLCRSIRQAANLAPGRATADGPTPPAVRARPN